MNIGLCYPHPVEGRKIFKQFLAVEPAQRGAGRQLGYKPMAGRYFYDGRLCISQAAAIKLVLATLTQFSYIFVRDFSILRQLTLMAWPASSGGDGQLKAALLAALSAEGKYVQSLAVLTRRLFNVSWKRLIPEKTMRSDRMAARVYSCLSLMIGNAGPGRMQLPVYAARILQAPCWTKWRLEECLVYLLLAVRAIPQADRRQLARLIQSTASPPAGDPAPSNPAPIVLSDADEVGTAGQSTMGDNEIVEIDPPQPTRLSNNTKAKPSSHDEAITVRTEADVSSGTGICTTEAVTSAVLSFTNNTSILADESALSKGSDSNSTHDDVTILSPLANVDENVPTAENPVNGSPASGDQIDGSIIDEIVEEILMEDKDYREEKLSAKRASEQVVELKQTAGSGASRDNKDITLAESGEQVTAEEPVGRPKRLIVEPDDQTRLTCLLHPPPSNSKPPYLVRKSTLYVYSQCCEICRAETFLPEPQIWLRLRLGDILIKLFFFNELKPTLFRFEI
jgi:hypothetical protein